MPTVSRQVSATNDDAVKTQSSEYGDSLSLVTSDCPAGRDYDKTVPETLIYFSGFRFLNITIPSGSTINSAVIKYTAITNQSVTIVNTKLEGEKNLNPVTFSTLANYDARPRTTAKVTWNNIPAWSQDVQYSSPDLTAIIQEIIDQIGWASGNAMVIFWNDNVSQTKVGCSRSGYSYEQASIKCAVLEIVYTPVVALGQAQGDGLIWIVSLLNKSKKPLRRLPLKGFLRGLKT